jgi:hypothetical protein
MWLFDTYLPLLDGTSSHDACAATQLRHGCISTTLQRTLRALHSLHARFARERIGLVVASTAAEVAMPGQDGTTSLRIGY